MKKLIRNKAWKFRDRIARKKGIEMIVLTSFISPYRSDRENARRIIGDENFIEIYVSTRQITVNTCGISIEGDDSKDDNSGRYETVEEFLHRYVDFDSEMLELGAGNGRFLLDLQKHGYVNIVGTDMSDESVNRLLQTGIAAHTRNIYDSVSEEETGKYD